jgi:deoxyribodipyrimidine photo-lyase
VTAPVPAIRVRRVNDLPLREDGDFVLFWMIASRRLTGSFGLERAVELSRILEKPLVILDALRCGYRWASDRIHRFVLDGMRDHADALAGSPVLHYPYVEPEPGAGSGLLEALSGDACAIVTDDFPSFMLPAMVAAAGKRVRVRLEAVDGNGLLPLGAAAKVFNTAHEFRRFLQKTLPSHLDVFPEANPLAPDLRPAKPLRRAITARWPRASIELLAGEPRALAALPIDHRVGPVPGVTGGPRAAEARLELFLRERLARYGEARNQPEEAVASGLSPYLHFGHISAHRVFLALMAREGWSRARLARKPTGSREGWWGASPAAESFLDELITWRELGFNMSSRRPDEYDRYESLPAWARKTLEEHGSDVRPHVYSLEDLERARTHDPLWNAAQMELVREGRIHGYLRMLWGKKILEWSPSPREALAVLIELNNKYALDGRDPSSMSGIFWCLGRYDRPWGPERPIYGKVRYMTSENTARKVRVKQYIARHAPR